MGRPRTASDKDILGAVVLIARERGMESVTFAAVAKHIGLAPATLVQRFGRKDAMVEAALQLAWDELEMLTEEADRRCAKDPDGAIDLLVSLTPNEFADPHDEGLLLLREDFINPRLRERGVRWRRMLTEALAARLRGGKIDAEELARLMGNQWQGALIWWGFARTGTCKGFLKVELRTLLRLADDQ